MSTWRRRSIGTWSTDSRSFLLRNWHGVHRVTGKRAHARSAYVESLFASLPVLPVDLTVARAYARTSAELARAGTPIDSNDIWIAATAIAHGFELLAFGGDFDRIPGVVRA